MSRTKEKLQRGQQALGSWIMIPHPSVAEIMAGEGFDWIGLDLEHTSAGIGDVEEAAMAIKGTDCDLLARLSSCDPVEAKRALDCGAAGIIVPSVNTPEQAALAVTMAKYPPEGIRGAALCRASGFGRNFADYYQRHNREVTVVVMIEHRDAVERVDAILRTPGIDAALIGPYDLSASMGLSGQLAHPDVLAAQQAILDACRRHGVAPGIFVPIEADEVERRVAQGFRFIACGIDTVFIQQGCRAMLKKRASHD